MSGGTKLLKGTNLIFFLSQYASPPCWPLEKLIFTGPGGCSSEAGDSAFPKIAMGS